MLLHFSFKRATVDIMRSLTCIVCPIGCSLSIAEGHQEADGFAALTITGNNCPRGAVYAQEEIRAPKRVVTATCAIEEEPAEATRPIWAPRRVPVKTLLPCPKERINDLLSDLYRLRLKLPVKTGDTVITDWQGTGITVVAVRAVG
jgi:CxxC motif-containing protein